MTPACQCGAADCQRCHPAVERMADYRPEWVRRREDQARLCECGRSITRRRWRDGERQCLLCDDARWYKTNERQA